jgi:hypothetical protein
MEEDNLDVKDLNKFLDEADNFDGIDVINIIYIIFFDRLIHVTLNIYL